MITLCATLYVLYLWVYCSHTPSVGWRFFSRQPKPVLTMRKITTCQDLKSAENSSCSSSTGFGPTLTTMTKLLAAWLASLTQMSAGFTATVCRISNLCSGQRRSQSLRGLQIVALSLSCLLTARNISVFLLGSCQVLVMQSFAFLFLLEQSRDVD